MRQKFTITESERKQIRGLYEQVATNPTTQPQQSGTTQTSPQSGTTQTPQVGTAQLSSKFEFGPNGLNNSIIVNVNGINAQTIYEKTINWVKETYHYPDKVLNASIPNQKVRLTAQAPLLTISIRMIGKMTNKFNVEYTLEIDIKDNKFRMSIPSINPVFDGIPQKNTNYVTVNTLKDPKYVKNFTTTAVDMENYFNNLAQSLGNYISGNNKDDW